MQGNTDNPSEYAAASEPADESTTPGQARRWLRPALIALGVLIPAMTALGAYWSLQPDRFDVQTVALERVGGDAAQLRPGAVAVSAIGEVARTLLEKPGGYLHNDISPPSIFLDNMPSWEDGAAKGVRDALRALRNDFSRSQTQSIESPELRKADEFLSYDLDSWLLPSTESEFREGIRALDRYFAALIAGNNRSARFYTRADNLAAYMAVVEKRLGSYAQRLSASVGDPELTAALVTEQTASSAGGERPQTPWLEIDDIFYEARGYTWTLLHVFEALAIEFEPILRDKNAMVSKQQMIRDLKEATKQMWSPMVLNGHGFGLVSNHSLVLASYMSRANAAVLDLRILLQQG